jgi:hypothetical protein
LRIDSLVMIFPSQPSSGVILGKPKRGNGLRSLSAASLIPLDKTARHGDILGVSLRGERDGVIGECLKRRQTNERRGRKAEIRQRPEMPKLRSNDIPTIWASFQV